MNLLGLIGNEFAHQSFGGFSVNFPANTDRIVGASSALDTSSSIQCSMACWLKITASNASSRNLFTFGKNRLDLNVEAGTNKLFVWFQSPTNGSGVLVGITSGSYFDNTWHFITINKTATTLSFYIDTVLIGSISTTEGTTTGNSTIFSAGGATGFGFAVCLVDNVRCWSRSLSVDEMNLLYSRGIVPSGSLVLEWLLNTGSGTTATDTSGSGNNGTLTGTPPTWSTDTPTI